MAASPPSRRKARSFGFGRGEYVERRVFPGGCFFSSAAADVGTRPGPLRDSIAAQQRAWLEILERLAREASELGDLARGADPAQLAFELHALLVGANTSFVLHGDAAALARARAAIRDRLFGASPAG
jgi:hypothetical protein